MPDNWLLSLWLRGSLEGALRKHGAAVRVCSLSSRVSERFAYVRIAENKYSSRRAATTHVDLKSLAILKLHLSGGDRHVQMRNRCTSALLDVCSKVGHSSSNPEHTKNIRLHFKLVRTMHVCFLIKTCYHSRGEHVRPQLWFAHGSGRGVPFHTRALNEAAYPNRCMFSLCDGRVLSQAVTCPVKMMKVCACAHINRFTDERSAHQAEHKDG